MSFGAHLLPDIGLLEDYKATLQRGEAPNKAQMALFTCKLCSLVIEQIK